MKKSNRRYDVIILGGGLAGASLAIALRNTQLKTLLIESYQPKDSAQRSFDDKTLALAHGSCQFLQQLGLWDNIRQAAYPIEHIHVSDRGHSGMVRLHAEDHANAAFGYVIAAKTLGHALYKALYGVANVELAIPAQVKHCMNRPGSTHVVYECQGETFEAEAKLVVVAMGANDTAQQWFPHDVTVKYYRQQAIVANLEMQKKHENWAFERFTESGPLAVLPLSQRQVSTVLTVEESESDKWMGFSEKEYIQAIQQRFGYRLGRVERASQRSSYPLVLRYCSQQYVGRAVFIGNASHGVHPIAGQGFNLGLRDVKVLSELLALENANGIGSNAMLLHYQELRNVDQKTVIHATDTLAEMFTSPQCVVKWGRSALCHTLNAFPILQEPLVKQAMGVPAAFSRGAMSRAKG